MFKAVVVEQYPQTWHSINSQDKRLEGERDGCFGLEKNPSKANFGYYYYYYFSSQHYIAILSNIIVDQAELSTLIDVWRICACLFPSLSSSLTTPIHSRSIIRLQIFCQHRPSSTHQPLRKVASSKTNWTFAKWIKIYSHSFIPHSLELKLERTLSILSNKNSFVVFFRFLKPSLMMLKGMRPRMMMMMIGYGGGWS